jgi:hypothetical protein
MTDPEASLIFGMLIALAPVIAFMAIILFSR